jgi:hypothetical protein
VAGNGPVRSRALAENEDIEPSVNRASWFALSPKHDGTHHLATATCHQLAAGDHVLVTRDFRVRNH